MADREALRERIVARYDTLSPQLQKAARYVLAHPEEVALVSMRTLSQRAGVQPATMTRLAKSLDLAGYDALRGGHAEALRQAGGGFATRLRQPEDNETALPEVTVSGMLAGLGEQLATLQAPQTLARIENAAVRLLQARRIYVLGLRACHVVAWHFYYVMSLLGERAVHLDGPGATGGDALSRATRDDVVLAVSVQPYAAHTLAMARLARDQGLAIVAITDSEVSPLATLSEQAIVCATQSDSFFHTLVPALAVSEILCGLLAEADPNATCEALTDMDAQLARLDTFAEPVARRGD